MKILLFLIFLIQLSFANYIKQIEILKDDGSINFKNIHKNNNFKKLTNPIKRETSHDNWFKITIDKDKFKEKKQYVLNVKSSFSMNKILFNPLKDYKFLDSYTIYLDDKTPKEIYIKVLQEDSLTFINIKALESTKYISNKLKKNQYYGITYGIIFSAFLYYLAFFIFNRQKSFLYYSLTQMSLFFILFFSNSPETNATDTIFYTLIMLGFLVFSNLFTREFLNTKKHAPRLDFLLILIIIISILNTITGIIHVQFPVMPFLIIYLVSAVYIYNKTKFKPILFYIIAWGIMIISLNIIEFSFYFIKYTIYLIDLEELIHLAAPLESLILAFALSYKVRLLEEEKIEKERLLIHQNKLASMGEMISNIAHQWRQPLTHLSYIFMNINTAFKHKKLDDIYLQNKSKEATNQLEYMSNTIDDFQNFYSPTKEKSEFLIKEVLRNALNILSSVLEANKIEVIIKGEDYKLEGFENELSQVLLNLITNSKDALLLDKINEPKIYIRFNKNSIIVEDNAKGIKKEFVNKIFEPYFTTKEKGSGIGLYMSKIIIEKHFKGTLEYQSKESENYFIVQFKQNNKKLKKFTNLK